MKKMIIFDPAIKPSTGACGPSLNMELIRISTAINSLKDKGILIERYNLTNNPQVFVDNKEVNDILEDKGVESLPITMVDGIIVKEGDYLSNEEISSLLEIPSSYLEFSVEQPKVCGLDGKCY